VVYIPGVLLISTIWGWRLGLVSALLSALAFNWFHIPPAGQLEIAADKDAVALVTFGIVALASSSMAEMARARAAEAERGREEICRSATVFAMEKPDQHRALVMANDA